MDFSAIARAMVAPIVPISLVVIVVPIVAAQISDNPHLGSGGVLLVAGGAGVIILCALLGLFVLAWQRPRNLTYSEHGHLITQQLAAGSKGSALTPAELSVTPRQAPEVGPPSTPEIG